jgi:hypothetical protein
MDSTYLNYNGSESLSDSMSNVSRAEDCGSLNSDFSVSISKLRTKPTVAGRKKPVAKNTGVWKTSTAVKKAAPTTRAAQVTVRYNTTTAVRLAAIAKKYQAKDVFQTFTKIRPAPQPTSVTVRYNKNATAKLVATRKALATAAAQATTMSCTKVKTTASKEIAVKTPPRRPQWKL